MTATATLMRHAFREVTVREANRAYGKARALIGLREAPGEWLTAPSANVKFTHTRERFTYGLSLMPANSAWSWVQEQGLPLEPLAALRRFQCCPWSTPACRRTCLATAGKGAFDNTKAGRTARTLLWAIDPDAAYTLLCHHLRRIVRKHGASNVAVRLNTLSDIMWERVLPGAFWAEFADVQFYDYTKAWGSFDRRPMLPDNYHLTVSASERMSIDAVREAVACGVNVAVVIDQHPDQPKPARWAGLPVVDGNATDARYLDPRGGHVVLLGALGKARSLVASEAGFVKPTAA